MSIYTPPDNDVNRDPSGAAISSRISRSGLFARIGLGLTAAVAGGAGAGALADGQSSGAADDRAVFAFAVELEQLQTAFYAQALRSGTLTGEARQFATLVASEERAHLHYLAGALGHALSAPPRYDFGDAFHDEKTFLAMAVSLEDTGLAAYNGQAGNLSSGALARVSRVISVEGRHSAWARSIAGRDPAPVAVDIPISATQARAVLKRFEA